MQRHFTSRLVRTSIAVATALLVGGCAANAVRSASAAGSTAEHEDRARIASVFALLERADGQRCRAMRDGQLACCATLVDGREGCWPRAADTIDWRSQPTMDNEQTAANTPITALLSTVSCATTVDRRQGCCARGHDGALRCWTDAHTPAVDDPANGPTARVVEGLRGVRRITAGGRRTCALLDDASVWCWGVNYDGRPVPRRGQPVAWRRRAWTPVAVRVSGFPAAADIVDGGSVDTGGSLCVVAVDGTVWCVDASVWTHDGTPRGRVEQIDGVRGATQLAIGSNHGCALTADGAVWCWGDGSYGQLGRGGFIANGDRRAARVELAPAQQIAAGWNTTCALLRDASVWCWGSSFFNVIGTGNLNHADRPVRVAALGPAAEIAVTHEHACARGEDGWLACWGSNSSAGPRTPVASGRVTDVAHLALGSFVSCALRRDGRAACWGGLDLGNGVQQWTEPTELPGIDGASRIVIGTAGGVAPTRGRVCAITANATVRCLGGARTVGED
jgi:hypothetical protein